MISSLKESSKTVYLKQKCSVKLESKMERKEAQISPLLSYYKGIYTYLFGLNEYEKILFRLGYFRMILAFFSEHFSTT